VWLYCSISLFAATVRGFLAVLGVFFVAMDMNAHYVIWIFRARAQTTLHTRRLFAKEGAHNGKKRLKRVGESSVAFET
jgi:hypothetical protein